MPEHRLTQLRLPGRELVLAADPDADLYRVREVMRLVFESPVGDREGSLLLVVRYEGTAGEYRMELQCRGVRELVLPEIGSRVWLTELEVNDIRDRQLEGCNWEVVSQFAREFRCLCGELEILSFDRLT